MEWSDSVESPPEVAWDFPFFDQNNDDIESGIFFFPPEDSHEFPLSSPNVPPDNHDDYDSKSIPQEFYAEEVAPSDNASNDRASVEHRPCVTKKQQSALNGSAFSSYILGLSSVNHQNLCKPADTHQQLTKQLQQSAAGPRKEHDTSTTRRHRPGDFSQNSHVQPCSRCHFFKLRCDGETPCWRCVRKGVGPECCKPPLQKARYVDAPVPWRRNGYVNPGIVENGLLVGPEKPTAIMFMTGMAGKKLGITPAWIEAIVSKIPPKLFQSLTDTVGKLLETDPSLAKMSPAAMTKKASAAAFDMYPSVAYLKQTYDWEQHSLDTEVNRVLLESFGGGAHPEELLDRFARNAMPATWTEFDFLCSALDDLPLVLGGLPNGTAWTQRFYFSSMLHPVSKHCVVTITRTTAKAVYDGNGRVKVVEKWMQPATVDEYDIALERTPELCRPLQAAVGDRRKGAEIVAMHTLERASESIATMKFSSTLRQKLEDLAGAVRDRYAPLVENAVKKRGEAAAALKLAARGSGGGAGRGA